MNLENLLMNEVQLLSVPTEEPSAEPTAFPTAHSDPTAVPSAAPTALDLIDFTAGHVLHNINDVEYNDQAATYDEVFKQIFSTIMGISQSAIVQIVVKENKNAFDGRFLATGDTSYMQYRVTLHDNSKSFSSLSALLRASVTPNPSNGVIYMNTLIASLAPGGSPLAAATIDEVDISNNLVGRDASSQLTGSMIAGLVIGIVLCLGLLGVAVAFFLKSTSKAAGNGNAYAAADTTELSPQEV
eukprot:GDKK01072676.1.p1 GENE.GDKK01072676.1~~GDKK01072676.1.p1  ORF type:complete len:242 (+),score=56.51 GDKK01072676.1:2-727(+)